MAVKRTTNPIALVRKRAAFLARVRRTATQVFRVRNDIKDVKGDVREFVRERVEGRGGPPVPPPPPVP